MRSLNSGKICAAQDEHWPCASRTAAASILRTKLRTSSTAFIPSLRLSMTVMKSETVCATATAEFAWYVLRTHRASVSL